MHPNAVRGPLPGAKSPHEHAPITRIAIICNHAFRLIRQGVCCRPSSTPRLAGAGARRAHGTNIGHENGEAIFMANVGFRVELTFRPRPTQVYLGHAKTPMQMQF